MFSYGFIWFHMGSPSHQLNLLLSFVAPWCSMIIGDLLRPKWLQKASVNGLIDRDFSSCNCNCRVAKLSSTEHNLSVNDGNALDRSPRLSQTLWARWLYNVRKRLFLLRNLDGRSHPLDLMVHRSGESQRCQHAVADPDQLAELRPQLTNLPLEKINTKVTIPRYTKISKIISHGPWIIPRYYAYLLICLDIIPKYS